MLNVLQKKIIGDLQKRQTADPVSKEFPIYSESNMLPNKVK